jgi:tRNA nucleotidyltransferase/poly(A) polymerase
MRTPENLMHRISAQSADEEKHKVLYLNDIQMVIDVLKEQNKKKPSDIAAKMLSTLLDIYVYVQRLHKNADTYKYIITDLEERLLLEKGLKERQVQKNEFLIKANKETNKNLEELILYFNNDAT